MLEECGLEYTIIPVDIYIGDQFKPEFLRISRTTASGHRRPRSHRLAVSRLSVFESGAILEYLADKTGKFLAREGAAATRRCSGVHWQMANLGPMIGQRQSLQELWQSPGRRREIARVRREALRGRSGSARGGHGRAPVRRIAILAGDEYTIADMITWPWARLIPNMIYEGSWEGVPNLSRWSYEVGKSSRGGQVFRMHSDLGESRTHGRGGEGPARAVLQPGCGEGSQIPGSGGEEYCLTPLTPSLCGWGWR